MERHQIPTIAQRVFLAIDVSICHEGMQILSGWNFSMTVKVTRQISQISRSDCNLNSRPTLPFIHCHYSQSASFINPPRLVGPLLPHVQDLLLPNQRHPQNKVLPETGPHACPRQTTLERPHRQRLPARPDPLSRRRSGLETSSESVEQGQVE